MLACHSAEYHLSGHWLDYDSNSKTLPAAENLTMCVLLVALTSSVNQTLWINVAIGALSNDQLSPLFSAPGGGLAFSLMQDF